MWEEKLRVYDELVSKCPRFERKGKAMVYTSANGYMFSLLNKAGEIGIRFSKEVQKKYIKEFDSSIYKSYNSIMHGYVLIPKRAPKSRPAPIATMVPRNPALATGTDHR